MAAVLAVLLILDVFAYQYAGARQDILSEVPIAAPVQNNRVEKSAATGYTYLGTYKNQVSALDADGNAAWIFDTSGSVEGLRVDDGRGLVIAGTQGRYIYILDAASGAPVREIKTGGRVYDLDYDRASGTILVSAPSNQAKGLVFLYDLDGNELLRHSTRPARAVRFAPGGQSFYVGDARANLTRLSLTGEQLAQVRMNEEIYALGVSAATGDVVAMCDDGRLARFDADLNELFSVQLAGEGRAADISEAGDLIGAGTREGDVYLLDGGGAQLFYTRMPVAVTYVALGEQGGFVVPWSEQIYALDASAALGAGTFAAVRQYARWGLYALPALLALSIALALGRSRSAVLAFFAALRRHRVAYLMLLPSFALIALFHYLPIGQAFFFAFTDWNQATPTMRDVNFIGLNNFRKMIAEGYFLLGMKNMLIMMAFSMLKLAVPLLVAELVFAMTGGRRRYWFRFLLVLPMVVPGVVSTLMWKNIYDPTIGLINQVLIALGRGDLARSWLGSEATALGSIIFMGFPWVNGFAFLVFYGGLINIPGDLFEAARVDGSNPAWNLMRIHLPLLTPQIKMIVILTFISSIQDYGSVLLLTGGGPGYATYVPGYEMYLNATLLGQYGYACALGLVMFVMILAGTVLNLKMKTEEALG
ncbi:MAG: ABC transporter permease subunit [Clostridiales bacterium]|nr:ABC transporter permease subunit [Clostridiales bacterium]